MNIKDLKLNLNKTLIITGIIALAFVISFFIWWNKEIVIIGPGSSFGESGLKSSIAGVDCENAARRPIAVMLAGDSEARPLSGLGQADIVFEMPVAPNGITRFMAVFQCEKPKEIGSVRSARDDFIPLAAGLKAIFAHWGGEREALAKLDAKIVDNIDAMKYEGTVFYRKNSIPRPHNGFTNIDLLSDKAVSLGYDLKDTFSGYLHAEDDIKRNLSNTVDTIDINYPDQYAVQWRYDEQTNSYLRSRGGLPEKDINSGDTVRANTIIVMKTSSRVLSKDYISVVTTGEGEAIIYQNGVRVNGRWKKDPSQLSAKLYLYDDNNQEIKFVPGKIWVEITTS